MARSKWKFISFSRFIWKNIIRKKLKNKKPKISFIYKRNSVIPKCLSNFSTRVHKGNIFAKVFTLDYAVGYKFGEFSFTRKPYHFPKKKSRK